MIRFPPGNLQYMRKFAVAWTAETPISQQAAGKSAFGQSPPDGFIVQLMGQVRGKLELDGLVMTDGQGPYLTLEGDPRVTKALGPLAKARFRDCDGARTQRVLAQRAADQADARRDAVQKKRNAAGGFGRAARAAFGPLARESWIGEVAGYDETPDSHRRIGGTEFRVERACKPHDCFDNNLVVVYDPATGAAYGKAMVRQRPSFFGSPPPDLQREIERLWRAEWRQGR